MTNNSLKKYKLTKEKMFNFISNEVSQFQKAKGYMFSLVCGI
jgi:hypothetical protein